MTDKLPPGVEKLPDGTFSREGREVTQDKNGQWHYKDSGYFLPGVASYSEVTRKGSHRKEFGRKFVIDFLEDWEANGKDVLKSCRESYPHMYLKVASQLIPKRTEVEHKVGDTFIELLKEISDQRKRLEGEPVDAEYTEVEKIEYNGRH